VLAALIVAPLWFFRPSTESLRDFVIIVYGVLGALLFAILILVGVGIMFSVRELTRAVIALIEDPLKPTINDVRATVQDIKGTTEFVADTAVSPLIRVVALTRGIRKGVSAASAIARRGRG
jgi:hypothetical protein